MFIKDRGKGLRPSNPSCSTWCEWVPSTAWKSPEPVWENLAPFFCCWKLRLFKNFGFGPNQKRFLIFWKIFGGIFIASKGVWLMFLPFSCVQKSNSWLNWIYRSNFRKNRTFLTMFWREVSVEISNLCCESCIPTTKVHIPRALMTFLKVNPPKEGGGHLVSGYIKVEA